MDLPLRGPAATFRNTTGCPSWSGAFPDPSPSSYFWWTGRRDQGGINDRALLHGHAIGLEVGFHGLKDLLAEIMLLHLG